MLRSMHRSHGYPTLLPDNGNGADFIDRAVTH